MFDNFSLYQLISEYFQATEFRGWRQPLAVNPIWCKIVLLLLASESLDPGSNAGAR